MGTRDYEKELDSWRQTFKEKWDYERTQVQFEDGNGNLFTQSPPSTTSTTTTSTVRPFTSKFTTVTARPVVVVNITSTTPRSGEAVSEASTEVLKLIGITVGVLVCFLLFVGFCILLCRRSKKNRDRNISVRRPLEGPEPEEHIYAEIEPLGRIVHPGGASGTTSDIPLPERKRRRGVSSFNGLSTRIQKFFSIRKSRDSQSMSYNKRNGESVMNSVAEAPEPPERNMNGKNRRDKPKKVHRGESTASQRPLLDGDSQISQPSTSSVDFRDSTYNALVKNESSRESGPYDTLNRPKSSDNSVDNDPPSSPHDYFTLEKNKFPFNEDSPVYNGGSDIVTLEQEPGNMETIEEVDAESDTEAAAQPHDYFVLKPHAREESTKGKNSPNDTSEMSVEVDKGDGNVENDNLASGSENSKPTPKPRLNKVVSGEKSPSHTGETEPSNNRSDNKKMNDYIAYNAMSAGSNSKEDDYEISKFGEAPKPPQEKGKMGEGEEEECNDYLLPLEEKARVYVDVFPNPPPRSTSLLHDSSLSDSQQKDLLTKTKDSPSSYVSSPTKSVGSPARNESSPSKSRSKSPTTPKTSPIRSVGNHVDQSPTKSAGSPTKSPGSPKKPAGSPSKSVGSPIRVVGSSAKSASSPVRLSGVPTHSTETEV